MTIQDEIKYQEAKKKVQKVKGFYTHAIVYVVVNLMIIVANIQNLAAEESYFQFKNFMTAFFWGIGLAAHGFSVFVPQWVLVNDWEERKIKEIMEREKNKKWE